MICSFCGNVTENVWAYRRLAELENRFFIDCPDCSAPLTLPEMRAALEKYAEQRGNGQNYIKGKDGKFEGSRPGSGSGSASGAGKGIDKSPKSAIMESEEKKPITQITDEAVNNVPYVQIEGYTAEQCAEIQRQHKELLKCSRDYNDCKEVAFFLDRNMYRNKLVKGTDDKLEFGEMYGTNLTVLHNHPRNSSFSKIDIAFLLDNDNVKTLTIVKNNGKVEYLTKSKSYDKKIFKLEYDRLYKKIVKNGSNSEKDKFVRMLLSKTKSGVIWSGRKENNVS